MTLARLSTLVALALCVAPQSSFAFWGNRSATMLRAANAVVLPFDVSDTRHHTTLTVSSPGGLSPLPTGGGVAAVKAVWTYWDEQGELLATISTCMRLRATVTVDPRRAVALDLDGKPSGPTMDLAGHRGFVVVTAYRPDSFCGTAIDSSPFPVDDAIVGSFTITEGRSTRAFGGNGIGFELDPTGSYTKLPADGLTGADGIEVLGTTVRVGPRRASSFSRVVLIALEEQAGDGLFADTALGPARGQLTSSAYYASGAAPDVISLPSLSFFATLFGSATATSGGLIPKSVDLAPAGTLELRGLKIGGAHVAVGNGTYVVGFHGQVVDSIPSTVAFSETRR